MSDKSKIASSKREFGAGSNEMSDNSDKFLFKQGYYRKHIAPDSTCLFRCVSELRHDIQLYHPEVRKECVEYMRNNKKLFEKEIKWNYYDYIYNMSRPQTYGTILELQALAWLHKANVHIFTPFKEPVVLVDEPSHESTWRLFRKRDKQFDVVFSIEYMKSAAYCQSIVYEVLMKNVLGLPDIEYMTERMLYDPNNEKTTYEVNEEGRPVAITEDGRQLVLSTAQETNCALSQSDLCHFHNRDGFEAVKQFFEVQGTEKGYQVYLKDYYQTIANKPSPLLHDPEISCIRQLLEMHISPVPYRVAKSLDPHTYRNVEYDTWMDLRREANIATMYQVGMKCTTRIGRSMLVCIVEEIDINKQLALLSTIGRKDIKYFVAIASLKPCSASKSSRKPKPNGAYKRVNTRIPTNGRIQSRNNADESLIFYDFEQESVVPRNAHDESGLSCNAVYENGAFSYNVIDESVISNNAAEESDLSNFANEESVLSCNSTEESVLFNISAEESDSSLKVVEESVISNNAAEESVISNNAAEKSIVSNNVVEESIISNNATKESDSSTDDLFNISADESVFFNISAEESDSSNNIAKESIISNNAGKESDSSNDVVEESILSNNSAKESDSSNNIAEESVISNNAVEESVRSNEVEPPTNSARGIAVPNRCPAPNRSVQSSRAIGAGALNPMASMNGNQSYYYYNNYSVGYSIPMQPVVMVTYYAPVPANAYNVVVPGHIVYVPPTYVISNYGIP